jgi:hypothetical protein
MGAHDQNVRPLGASEINISDHLGAESTKPDSHAYYAVLAERLEKLLLDMQKSGTASDDPLMLRLADLLSETRGLLRKSKAV